MSRKQQLDWNTASFNIPPEIIEMTRQMSVAMLEHCQALCSLHLDTLDNVTGESARQFRQALQSVANSDARPNQWPEQFYLRRRKFVEIARGWLDMSTQATAEINQLWGQSLTASLKLGEPKSVTYPQRDRRIGAMVISFADRRRSAHRSKAGSTNSTAGQASAGITTSRPGGHRNSA